MEDKNNSNIETEKYVLKTLINDNLDKLSRKQLSGLLSIILFLKNNNHKMLKYCLDNFK